MPSTSLLTVSFSLSKVENLPPSPPPLLSSSDSAEDPGTSGPSSALCPLGKSFLSLDFSFLFCKMWWVGHTIPKVFSSSDIQDFSESQKKYEPDRGAQERC